MAKVALGRQFVAEWAYTREGAPAMVPDSDRKPALFPETAEEMLPRKTDKRADSKSGAEPMEAEVIAFCRDNMAHFKAPRRVVFGPLPKTSTGKVQKFVLRERARDPD